MDIQGQDSLCAFNWNSTLLSANVSGGTGAYSYSWSDTQGRTSTRSTFFVWNSNNTIGTVTVYLQVTDGSSFFGTDTFQIHFTAANCPPIQAQFSHWPDTPCVGRPVQFWDSVMNTSSSVSTSWDFGDGNTANNIQIGWGTTHTYTQAGTYTVTYCAYDSIRNDTSCVSKNVVVRANCPQVTGTISGPDTLCIGAPTGVFTANPSSGNSNPQYSYRWQIGTQTYFSQTITHTFQLPGTYGISLRIIDWSIPDTVYIQDTVVVEPGSACLQPLQVAIQGQDTVCLSQTQTVLLNATVSGGVGNYVYDWSDSRGGRSTRTTHFVWASTPQTVTVWLDVTDGNGLFFGSDTFQVVFTLGGTCPPITPIFGFSPNPGCVGQPVYFWDSTGLSGSTFSTIWDMGDGTIYNNPIQVAHTYTQAGTYQLRYCLVDTANQDTFCTTDSIVVNARCWPQISADSAFVLPDSVCPGQSITYFGLYSGGPRFGGAFEYWDFGDGSTQSGGSATHSYSQSGTYTAQYCVVDTVYNDTSCLSRTVHVLSTCQDTVSGYVYHDINQDGMYNAGDAPLGGYPVRIAPGGSIAFADAQGYYEMPLAPGSYVVNAPTIPSYNNTSPATGTYLHNLGGTFGNYQGDFGYDSIPSSHDLDVWLYCSPPRPGFSHWISVYFSNKGTTPVSGTITLSYDPQTNFQYTTPLNNGVHDPVNHTVTWSFTNLPTGIYRQRVRAWFTLPASVPLGNILNASVSIDPKAGDLNITNNVDSCAKTVVGSFDPNDKQVNQPPVIQGDEWLLYTVRFQNTGTDTAFNVVVRDAIDSNLDLNTFQMLGSSHQYSLNIDASGEAAWTFNNILLPDSNTNEPLSHGHIMYRVKPFQGLAPGTSINNTAAIYFDFNAPIITNTTTNSIAFPVSIDDDFEQIIPGLVIYPNPANEIVNIAFANDKQLKHQLRLIGVDGKVLQQKQTQASSVIFDLHNLPAGVYMLHISNTEGMHSYKKVIKE